MAAKFLSGDDALHRERSGEGPLLHEGGEGTLELEVIEAGFTEGVAAARVASLPGVQEAKLKGGYCSLRPRTRYDGGVQEEDPPGRRRCGGRSWGSHLLWGSPLVKIRGEERNGREGCWRGLGRHFIGRRTEETKVDRPAWARDGGKAWAAQRAVARWR